MKTLRNIKAKPNPRGKDRHGSYTPPTQLAAEWVDENNGTEAFPLNGMGMHHIVYQSGCRDGRWQEVMNFQGS
jgi:hypothetical protein